MDRVFCRVSAEEIKGRLEQMHPFDANYHENRFRVWKNYICENRLFTAFTEARIKDAPDIRFDHETLRKHLLIEGGETVFIAHSKTGDKEAFILGLYLQSPGTGIMLSGDAWFSLSDAVYLLRESFHLPEEREDELYDICTDHLMRIRREFIRNCSYFIYVPRLRSPLDAARLDARTINHSPWLLEEVVMAQELALGPGAPDADNPDLGFLPPRPLADLLQKLAPRERPAERKLAVRRHRRHG